MFNIQGFYKIKSIVNCGRYKDKIKTYLLSQSVKGTVILSPEGINGTIAGKKNQGKILVLKIDKNLYININRSAIAGLADSVTEQDTQIKTQN